MCADVVILLDTKSSGRYFDARTCCVEPFATLQELQALCQSALEEDARPAGGVRLLRYPAKGKLASLHVSIYAVDRAGAHGILHLSSARRDMFKSTGELERLINREACLAFKRQQRKAKGGRAAKQAGFSNATESGRPCQPGCVLS